MAVREDLVQSADPSVAAAPLDKRIAFLQSKNLTQEEIDLSLSRAGTDGHTSSFGTATSSSPSYSYQQRPVQYGSPQSQPPPYWQQPPPPELPKRDWRDWFIMATVMGGVTWGCYVVAKRYIYPLIAPPTLPQLEQDKSQVDASFEKAFDLLEQLAADTEALKSAEKARTEKLDVTLAEVESVISEMKSSTRRYDEDSRRHGEEIRALKDLIPKAMEGQKESADQRLRELSQEMKSLKTLIGNRMATNQRPASTFAGGVTPIGGQKHSQDASANGTIVPTESATEAAPIVSNNELEDGQTTLPTSFTAPDRTASSSPYGRMMNGRAAIPAWQMAARKNQEEAAKKDTTESGTITEASPGS
ncbi:peroxisomal membrane protein pex14 [Elasticomyces elasticus]|nr:peroxisomal membrane protein pex14 [Elasticomyces elasticus]KAK4993054.1 peroxisomal membrane protein pex14 [Elasticomyces elasticus]